jgi:hypothetical protein
MLVLTAGGVGPPKGCGACVLCPLWGLFAAGVEAPGAAHPWSGQVTIAASGQAAEWLAKCGYLFT